MTNTKKRFRKKPVVIEAYQTLEGTHFEQTYKPVMTDTKKLVEDLRQHWRYEGSLLHEAADTIERLQTANDQLNECILNTKKDILDDMREWQKDYFGFGSVLEFLDAYEKEQLLKSNK